MLLLNVIIFAFGMFAQAFLMLQGKWEKGDARKILVSFLIGLLGMFPDEDEDVYDLTFHLFLSYAITAFTFTSMFSRKLISRVGARTILILNILLLFLLYEEFGFSYIIFGVLLIPSLLTLANSLSDLGKTFHWQVFFYTWFSVTLVSIGILHFGFRDFFTAFGWGESNEQVGILNVFFSGGVFLYILSNAWYAIKLIPLRDEYQSKQDRMRDIKKHMHLLAYGYIWEKNDLFRNIVIVIVFPLLLLLNYKFSFISKSLFVSVVLVLLPFISSNISNVEINDGVGLLKKN